MLGIDTKKNTHKEKLRNRRCKLCKKPVKHEGANPDHAKLTELNFTDGQIHLITSVVKGSIEWDICPEYSNFTKKKIKL